jgi:hypothetical protein
MDSSWRRITTADPRSPPRLTVTVEIDSGHDDVDPTSPTSDPSFRVGATTATGALRKVNRANPPLASPSPPRPSAPVSPSLPIAQNRSAPSQKRGCDNAASKLLRGGEERRGGSSHLADAGWLTQRPPAVVVRRADLGPEPEVIGIAASYLSWNRSFSAVLLQMANPSGGDENASESNAAAAVGSGLSCLLAPSKHLHSCEKGVRQL